MAKLNLKGRSALATQEDLQEFEHKRVEVSCHKLKFYRYFYSALTTFSTVLKIHAYDLNSSLAIRDDLSFHVCLM